MSDKRVYLIGALKLKRKVEKKEKELVNKQNINLFKLGERTFSKLKLIKNELRTCMLQERLNSLSLMSIESELLQKIDFDDVVNDFILAKRRKINIE